ncbi:MAG: hypothetical protein C6I00_00125 [Nitratiruptor sp.]|nr:hypothetical protein [Nitratiruptor sp.]NPA83651.1 AI-2E family transporter [Campylobacterota bacterium]
MIHFSATLVALVALKFLAPVLVYVILSIFLAIILTPIMGFFEKRGLPSLLGYLVALLLFLLLFGTMFHIVNFSAREFLHNAQNYRFELLSLLDRLGLNEYKFDLALLKEFDLLQLAKGLLAKAGAIVQGFLVVFIGVSFLLFEQRYIYRKIALLSPKADIEGFFHSTQKYFLIKTFTSLLTGLFVALMLWAFQVPYWAVLGIMAFLFNFIPVVGSIIAAIPGILMALLSGGVWMGLYVAGLYLVINISISNILEPKLMGEGLDLSPAVVFFSLVLWGWIFGAVGMFLAVPLTMTLKMALESDERTKRWAMLLAK